MVGRNDKYLGDFLGRMQKSVDELLIQCSTQKVLSELIIVDWNPPKNRLPLEKALNWTYLGYSCRVKIVTVPNELHRTIENSDKMPLFEYIGKNVGIRRAQGNYIVCMNPDIVLSGHLASFILDTRNLSTQTFYRTPRLDLDETDKIVQWNWYLGSQKAGENLKDKMERLGLGILDYLIWRLRHFPLQKTFTNAAGDFLLTSKLGWSRAGGYPEVTGVDVDGYHHADSFILYQLLRVGLRQKRLKLPVYHMYHGDSTDTGKPVSQEVGEIRRALLKGNLDQRENLDWGLSRHHLVVKTMRRP